LGGTFDRLHVGHRLFLSSGLLAVKPVGALVVGLADGPLLANKSFKEMIQPFDKRKETVIAFLNLIYPDLNFHVVQLFDVHGPSVTDPDIDCLVVTDETERGVSEINQRRLKNGLFPLKVVHTGLVGNNPVLGEDKTNKMSSSSLRRYAWEMEQKKN